jgi:hypothetical protein
MMANQNVVERIKRNCKEVMINEPRLRRKIIVDEIIQFAESVVTKRKIVGTSQLLVEREFGRYEQEIKSISRRFWLRRRIKSRLVAVALKYFPRRLIKYIKMR